jgi:hypothetical protein
MKRLAPILVSLSLAASLSAVPPRAALAAAESPSSSKANWSIGADLELSWVDPDPGPTATVLAWPADVGWFQPGIRIGYTRENTPSEFYVATGLALVTGGGSSSSDFELTANYQYNFKKKNEPSKPMTPYLTGGLGLVSTSFSTSGPGPDVGATSLVYGFGAGLRHRVAEGHGSIRTEVRFDHITEGDDGAAVPIPSSNAFGIRVGFDLWMK